MVVEPEKSLTGLVATEIQHADDSIRLLKKE